MFTWSCTRNRDYRKNKGDATFEETVGRIFHAFSSQEAPPNRINKCKDTPKHIIVKQGKDTWGRETILRARRNKRNHLQRRGKWTIADFSTPAVD